MVIKKASGWIIATAVVFMLLGIFSIIEPGIAGLAVAILVGWVLIFGGVAHLVAMFSGGGVGRVIWQALIGFVYVVGGFYFAAERRAAEDQVPFAEAKRVGEVGMAAGILADFEGTGLAGEMLTEIGFELCGV